MGQQGGLAGMMLPLAMFAAIFYFLIIRPQKKQQKAKETMLSSITRGTTVVTAGGFFGIVREILDDSYILELDENTKVRILKTSVSMTRDGAEVPSESKERKVRKVKKIRKVADGEESAQPELTEAAPVVAEDAQDAPAETVADEPQAEAPEAEKKEEENA